MDKKKQTGKPPLLGCVNAMSRFCSAPAKWHEAFHTLLDVAINFETKSLAFDPETWTSTPDNREKVLENSWLFKQAQRRFSHLGLPGRTRSFISAKSYSVISGCRTATGILAFFYAPTLQEWVNSVMFLVSPKLGKNISNSNHWTLQLKRSTFVPDGFLYVVMYQSTWSQHSFSVLSCLYGKTRLFLLFQGFSDEYTVCDWAHQLNEVRSVSFQAFQTPMGLEAMLHFVQLWQSLEGPHQVINAAYVQTYKKLTGVNLRPSSVPFSGKLVIKTLRFSPTTIDQQINSRFAILEKFSWIVPKDLKEECRRGDTYSGMVDPFMSRMQLLQGMTSLRPTRDI